MLDAAAAAHPREACGLLLGSGAVDIATEAANVAADPTIRFEIDPPHLFAALRTERSGGPAILGYWHSHPAGLAAPSPTDAAMADPDERIWAIVAGDRLGCFRAVAGGALHGRFDPVEWRFAPD
jgi:desampylase